MTRINIDFQPYPYQHVNEDEESSTDRNDTLCSPELQWKIAKVACVAMSCVALAVITYAIYAYATSGLSDSTLET